MSQIVTSNQRKAILISQIVSRLEIKQLNHKDLLLKIERIESEISSHDDQIKILFNYLKNLLQEEDKPRRQVGFKIKK